jgi:hypothetical protein
VKHWHGNGHGSGNGAGAETGQAEEAARGD